jgi:hypothetical protein
MILNGMHILVWILAFMAIISNSIGIYVINDSTKDKERFLIFNLVASIVLILIFSYMVYRDFISNTF